MNGGIYHPDTEQDALVGKLGQCESGVQKTFRRLDAAVEEIVGAVDRHAIRRGGEWMGRSYKLGGKLLLRVDPKVASLRVQVGKEAYAAAPAVLRDAYKQDDWIVVRPEHMDEVLACMASVVTERMQRHSRGQAAAS